MTSVQLATMSTGLWVVATVSLFILLAGWSTGSSWGLTASLVRGVRGWSDRDGRPITTPAAHPEPLRPILDPYAVVRRPGPSTPPRIESDAGAQTAAGELPAEVIDLGARRLPR